MEKHLLRFNGFLSDKDSFWLITCFSLVLNLSFELQSFSQEKSLPDKWSYNTAFLMPAGKWETGIFQPFRYGISEKVELNAAALLFPVLPNVGIKINLGEKGKFRFASEHSISIPSIFLNIVSFKGTGGLISPQYSFSFMTSFSNCIIASMPLGSKSVLSADAGIAFALRTQKPNYQSTIDIPFIYQRTAHWYDGASIKAEVLYRGMIGENLLYEECMRVFLITRSSDNLFIENSGGIMWLSGGSLRIKAGYLLSWGKYPFGDHWQMWPAIDLIFGSKVKK
jgi:hypothetical protein